MQKMISELSYFESYEQLYLFLNKLLFWWSASIALDNNDDILAYIQQICHTLYFTRYLSWFDYLYFYSIFSLKYLAHLTSMLPVGSL